MAFWFDAARPGGGRMWVGFIRQGDQSKHLPYRGERPEKTAAEYAGAGWEDVPEVKAKSMAESMGWGINFDTSFRIGD